MEHVIECLAKNNLHEALVRCWKLLKSNFPLFQDQEALARDPGSGNPYQVQKARIHQALLSSQSLKIRNLPTENPLAFLEVLDGYLYHRHSRSGGLALSPQFFLEGEAFMMHRRIFVRQPDFGLGHASKTGHLQTWLRHHWIVPTRIHGIEIRFLAAPESIVKAAGILLNEGRIRIYVGAFSDAVEPHWLTEDPTKWSTRKLTDPEKRWSSIVQSLEEARNAGASMIVLPELTVSPDLRGRVADWLDDLGDNPFMLVAPGSYHEEKDSGVFNIAELLSRSGHTVLQHKKLTRFGDNLKQEAINTGKRLDLPETPLGTVGIPICLDFCEEGEPFNALWASIGAEWLLVPACGPKSSISAHRRRARELFRAHGTVSAVANQELGDGNPAGSESAPGFVCHTPEDPVAATTGQRVYFLKLQPTSAE